ncbi:MAG: NADH-quinone oxidoreductase chain 5 [Chitinophagaceae bacterium]
MTNDELKIKLSELQPSVNYEEGSQWLTVLIEPQDWLNLANKLRYSPELHFDFLFCLTCIDWKTHLTMVYHLESTIFRHTIVVKSKLNRTKPEIETVSQIWKTAEFHEREVWEMFGVYFMNHPDLRLLILPEGWEGKFPLRKDFEDPVNMIKL